MSSARRDSSFSLLRDDSSAQLDDEVDGVRITAIRRRNLFEIHLQEIQGLVQLADDLFRSVDLLVLVILHFLVATRFEIAQLSATHRICEFRLYFRLPANIAPSRHQDVARRVDTRGLRLIRRVTDQNSCLRHGHQSPLWVIGLLAFLVCCAPPFRASSVCL